MSESSNTQGNASGRNSKILLGVCAVVIAVLVVVIIQMSGRQQAVTDEGSRVRPILVTEDNVQEVITEMSQPVEAPTSYQVMMTTTWHFRDGASESSDAYVKNAASNETDVYFDLVLDGSEEVVLESPIIPLGASMRNMRLDKPLSAGSYPATVVYHLVDESQKTLSTVRMGVTLVIAN